MAQSINEVSFRALSAEEWKKFAVCEINTGYLQGGSIQNTPYDARLGCLSNSVCETCRCKWEMCCGHYGYIELYKCVYNPFYIGYIKNILSCICWNCYSLRIGNNSQISPDPTTQFRKIVKLSKKIKECENCNVPLPQYTLKDKIRVYKYFEKDKFKEVLADDAYRILDNIPPAYFKYLGLKTPPSSFIFKVLPVVPLSTRPWVIGTDREKKHDDITIKYNEIIKANITLGVNLGLIKSEKKIKNISIEKAYEQLISKVYCLIDSSKDYVRRNKTQQIRCINKRIKSKEGHVNKFVNGKRCNYTARSVIDGGPTLPSGYVGVPGIAASNLYKKEIVTPSNYDWIMYLRSQNKINSITTANTNERRKCAAPGFFKFEKPISIGDTIERHLLDNDIVIFNRQPTLRPEAMNGMRAKIFPEDTCFRFNLDYTRLFNADYDGDEMNLHVTQTIASNAETSTIMSGVYTSLSMQANAPIVGIVQDSLVGMFVLTNVWNPQDYTSPYALKNYPNHTYITKQTCFDLMCVAQTSDLSIGRDLEEPLDFLRRCVREYPEFITIHKKKLIVNEFLPGKILASFLLPKNFNYSKVSNTNPRYPKVIIRNGIITKDSGPLCKKIIGVKSDSIFHSIFLSSSPQIASNLLSRLQFVGNKFLTQFGFSIGVVDCTVKSRESLDVNISAAMTEYETLLKSNIQNKEVHLCKTLNNLSNLGVIHARDNLNKGEYNAMNIMMNSGAKGSPLNSCAITGFIGQQNVGGERIPLLLTNNTRSSSHFLPNETSPESRGFIRGNYITGLKPTELIFCAFAAREGTIDTALKTADVGYSNKKIAKKAEDVTVRVNGTLQNTNGTIISFVYGDDGANAKYLNFVNGCSTPLCINNSFIEYYSESNNYSCLKVNSPRNSEVNSKPFRNLTDAELEQLCECIVIGSPGLQNCATVFQATELKKQYIPIFKKMKVIDCGDCHDRCDNRPTNNTSISFFETQSPTFSNLLLNFRKYYLRSKVCYGEMVGLCASSAISEPITQSTLNVFHTAGSSAPDVTVGFARTNELLNATKTEKQKTPSVEIYFTRTKPKEWYTAKTVQFEEILIQSLILKSELMCTRELPDECKSPIDIFDYEIFKQPLWFKYYINLFKKDLSIIESSSWVLKISFDLKLMYAKKIKLHTISKILEEDDRIVCVCSPDCIGEIFVYGNCELLAMRVIEADKILSKKKHATTEMNILSRTKLITRDNQDYFVYKDIIQNYVITTKVSGIQGIKITNVRNNPNNKDEYIIDATAAKPDLRKIHKFFRSVLNVSGVDQTRTISNNIYEIKEVLGIEAARAFLGNEMHKMIGYDGTYINPRHTHLLTECMTYTGKITSISQYGIDKDAGIISKATFERQTENFSSAAIFNESDMCHGLASSIVVGKCGNYGTGTVTVLENTITNVSKKRGKTVF